MSSFQLNSWWLRASTLALLFSVLSPAVARAGCDRAYFLAKGGLRDSNSSMDRRNAALTVATLPLSIGTPVGLVAFFLRTGATVQGIDGRLTERDINAVMTLLEESRDGYGERLSRFEAMAQEDDPNIRAEDIAKGIVAMNDMGTLCAEDRLAGQVDIARFVGVSENTVKRFWDPIRSDFMSKANVEYVEQQRRAEWENPLSSMGRAQ